MLRIDEMLYLSAIVDLGMCAKFFVVSRTNLIMQDVFSISFECSALIRYFSRFLIFEHELARINKLLNENRRPGRIAGTLIYDM